MTTSDRSTGTSSVAAAHLAAEWERAVRSSSSPSSYSSSSFSTITSVPLHATSAAEEHRYSWGLLWKPLCAGAMARCTAATLLSPFDVVKARMQFQRNSPQMMANKVYYRSVSDALVQISKAEGLRGFYHGLGIRLMYVAPAAAISFACYEEFSKMLKKRRDGEHASLHPAIPLLAGGLARVLGTAARTPFDIVRQRLQIQHSVVHDAAVIYSGPFDAFRKILRTEGIRSLFVGFPVTLLRDVPFAAIYFLSYEYGKITIASLTQADTTARLSPPYHLLCGAVAGAIGATFTIPFDLVKTRLQTQKLIPDAKQHYKGVWHAMKTIVKEEGVHAFTRSLRPRLLVLVPAASITFASYEQFKRLLQF